MDDAGYAFKGTRVVGGDRACGWRDFCLCKICCGIDGKVVGYRGEDDDCSEEEETEDGEGNQECSTARHGPRKHSLEEMG